MKGIQIYFFLLCVLVSKSANALEKADVLPEGIFQGSLRIGLITGLGDKFHSDGLLGGVGDSYSKTFDSETLTHLLPEARALVNALNQFGNFRYGDRLNLGTLKFDPDPTLTYQAPVLAYGFSKRFTLALAVPIIHYSVHANVYQTPSNMSDIASNLPQDLRDQIAKLRTNLPDLFRSQLATAGYASFSDRNTTFVSDTQVIGLYQYHHSDLWNGTVRSTVILPTGPKDDPDDLLDLPFFGQTAVGLEFDQDMMPFKHTIIGAYAGHLVKVPDHITARVPKDSEQVLPPSSQKEDVIRDLGDVTTLGVNTRYEFTEALEAGVGLEFGFKGADTYSGSNGSNYSLLSRESQAEWQKVQVIVEYSTTELYLRKAFPFPCGISYEYGDIVGGVNTERQISHELVLKAYF